MRVNLRYVEDVVIAELDGDLVAGVGDEVLRDLVNDLLAADHKKVLLSLAGVDRLDSAGLGELVASWKLAHRFGSSIRLLRPGDRVRQTLHLSQILPLLDVYEDEALALADFRTVEAPAGTGPSPS